ncbi:MAG TPA: hypothetical protein VMR25_15420 [Planctomycetaceae bacterium]|nr:hypothetical protein [Planctomycetaceae bacterium]
MVLATAPGAVKPATTVIEILGDLVARLRIYQVQLKIYEQCLTPSERQDYDEASQEWDRPVPIDMWLTRRRGISHKLAIVQLAFRTDLLSLSDRDWLLRELGEEFPIDWEIQHAVSLGGLVIVDEPPTVFWECLKINLSWKQNRTAWNVFSQLARRARQKADLSETDVYPDDAVSDAALATAVSRLKSKLPSTLAELIGPGIRPRTQRLNLDRDRIRIFRSTSGRTNASN